MARRTRRALTSADAIEKILGELRASLEVRPQRLASPEEGYAFVRIKLEELFEAVRELQGTDLRTSALQLAAVAVRFAVECT